MLEGLFKFSGRPFCGCVPFPPGTVLRVPAGTLASSEGTTLAGAEGANGKMYATLRIPSTMRSLGCSFSKKSVPCSPFLNLQCSSLLNLLPFFVCAFNFSSILKGTTESLTLLVVVDNNKGPSLECALCDDSRPTPGVSG